MGNVDDGINEHLAEENERLTLELEALRQQYANLTSMLHQRDNLSQNIIQYLPQLTAMSTNMSYVASAVNAQTIVLERIAKVFEDRSKGIGVPL